MRLCVWCAKRPQAETLPPALLQSEFPLKAVKMPEPSAANVKRNESAGVQTVAVTGQPAQTVRPELAAECALHHTEPGLDPHRPRLPAGRTNPVPL